MPLLKINDPVLWVELKVTNAKKAVELLNELDIPVIADRVSLKAIDKRFEQKNDTFQEYESQSTKIDL